MIDIKLFELHAAPPRQVLFDYFQDPDQVRNLQVYLHEKGWKIVKMEDKDDSHS